MPVGTRRSVRSVGVSATKVMEIRMEIGGCLGACAELVAQECHAIRAATVTAAVPAAEQALAVTTAATASGTTLLRC